MNATAGKLGLVDTRFVDPSGLGADNVSSVHDMWLLTRYLYEHHPVIITISGGGENPERVSRDRYTGMQNFNAPPGETGFVGGKIGETNAAGQTSVTLHRLSWQGTERTVVIVFFGSIDRANDLDQLLEYLSQRFGGALGIL
jgi:D-alanyl-D-alanine carboxypeptidase